MLELSASLHCCTLVLYLRSLYRLSMQVVDLRQSGGSVVDWQVDPVFLLACPR